MNDYVDVLIQKFKSKGLLIDANILLLYLVGSYNPQLIGDGKYNKLSKYTVEDYRILIRLRGIFNQIVTTPHVLTEVSNLAGDFPESIKSGCLSKFCTSFEDMDELNVPSLAAARRSEFHFLGLTDCALAQVADKFLVVTDDGRFVKKLNQSGLEALNFNHLRGYLFRDLTRTHAAQLQSSVRIR